VYIPTKAATYTREQIMKMNALINSRAINVATLAQLNLSPLEGGQKVIFPFWKEPKQSDVVFDVGDTLTPTGFEAGTQEGFTLTRTKSYGINKLLKSYAGNDPFAFVNDEFARYWSGHNNRVVLSILKGLFANTTTTGMTNNYSDLSANVLNAGDMITALTLLGDQAQKISALYMHSAVEAHLSKLGEIITVQPWEGSTNIRTYKGKVVLIDDTVPYNASTKIGRVYLLGENSFIYCDDFFDYNEIDTIKDKMDTVQYTTKVMLIHPNGVNFSGTSFAGAKKSPANSDLENPANWLRVFEDYKNVPITAVDVKVS
jgi:hypothetical protein